MNVTFDLETLGTTYNAPIVQIAAVKFKDSGTVVDRFTRDIDYKTLEPLGFEMTYSTVFWWLSQPVQAIKSVFNKKHSVSLQKALLDLQKWLGPEAKEYYYWSHASFDFPILQNAYNKLSMQNPIPYHKGRDIRTLQHFAQQKVVRKGTHHNALDDCLYQAELVSKSILKMNLKVS